MPAHQHYHYRTTTGKQMAKVLFQIVAPPLLSVTRFNVFGTAKYWDNVLWGPTLVSAGVLKHFTLSQICYY
jgi:hypothetical protein